MKPSKLAVAIKSTILAKKPFIIVGPPGVGKTEVIEQVAKKTNHELLVMYPAISEPTDFKGYPTYNHETREASFVPFDTLKLLIEARRPTIVLLDDFGQANQSVQAAAMHLLRARKVGEFPVSDNVTFIIATNNRQHHAGVAGVLEPVKSRAISIIHLEVDLEDWIKWALENQIVPEVIAFMRLRGNDLLSSFVPTTDLTNTPSPRGQESVSDIVKMGLPADIEYEMIKGAMGEGYAVELRGFLTLFRNLPDPAQILQNPETIDVPDNPMVIYAYCGALASIATPENMDKIVAFANRIPIEFQVKLLQYDCKHTNSSNHETAAYTEWAINNQDILAAA